MIFLLFNIMLGMWVGTAPADTREPETTPTGDVQPAEQPTSTLAFYTSGFL